MNLTRGLRSAPTLGALQAERNRVARRRHAVVQRQGQLRRVPRGGVHLSRNSVKKSCTLYRASKSVFDGTRRDPERWAVGKRGGVGQLALARTE